MPATLSGNVFSLSGDAQYEGRWNGLSVLRANAGVDVRTTVDATAALCHGLHVSLKANATAEAEAALAMFVAARAEAQAFAQAGANIKLTLTPNLFDRIGLTLDAGAFAEAAVAARLSLGLDLGQISAAGELLLRQELGSNLAFAIFEAFLEELAIGAGVWGRAAFSAMARAHLQVYGSLADQERAGFVFELGGSVGLKGGTGWDFFAEARLRDPRRFYGRCVRLITAELVATARAELDSELDPAIELLELLLPIAMQAAYELGQRTVAGALGTPQESVRPFLQATLAELRGYALRKVGAYADRLLHQLVSDLALRLLDRDLDHAERTLLIERVQTLLLQLGDGEVAFEDLPPVISAVIDVVTTLVPEEVDVYARPLAMVWTTFATVHVTANVAASASVGVAFLGLGAGVSTTEADFVLPTPPSAVRAVYEAFFGGSVPEPLHLSDGVDYLVATGVSPLLDQQAPEAAAVLDRLAMTFDLSVGDVASALLVGGLNGDLSSTELYLKLRDFVRDAVDEEVEQRLVVTLEARLADNSDALLYLREVARPCLLGLTNFVFERLDQFVAGQVLSALTDNLKQAASTLVYKAFARNVIVLGYILKRHVLAEMHRTFGELEAQVRSGAAQEFITTGTELLRTSVPGLAAHPTPTPESIQALLGELLGAGREAFGPTVWNPARLEELRLTLLEALLNEDQGVDYSSPDALEAFFAALLDCETRPNEAALARLGVLFTAITLEELEILIRRVVPAFAEFYLALTADQVAALDAQARALIDELARRVEELLARVEELGQEIARQIALAVAAVDQLADQIALIRMRLGSPTRRALVLDALYARGAQTVTDAVIAVTPDWDGLDADEQAGRLALPLAGFALAFAAVRPFIDAGLATLGAAALPIETTVRGAADAPELLLDFGALIAEEAAGAIADQLAAAGLVLPPEISVGQAAELAKELLVTDEVEALLRQALAAVAAERAARNAEAQARAERVLAEDEQRQAAARREALRGGALKAEILSPADVSAGPATAFVYPPTVPLCLTLRGANPTFIESGAARRVLIAVNAQAVDFPPSAWSFEENAGRLTLRAELRLGDAPLEPGLNVIEVSVMDGDTQLLRERVGFVLDPAAGDLGEGLRVMGELSRFDAPGDDHRNLAEEYVTIGNQGGAPVPLLGWQMRDRKGHTFVFPELLLAPNETVSVHTGGHPPTGALVWGRGLAVWNNRGDTVYLVDGNRVLRHEHVY